eukprot:365286-Chlamydomonas_euryale.AAC.1
MRWGLQRGRSGGVGWGHLGAVGRRLTPCLTSVDGRSKCGWTRQETARRARGPRQTGTKACVGWGGKRCGRAGAMTHFGQGCQVLTQTWRNPNLA